MKKTAWVFTLVLAFVGVQMGQPARSDDFSATGLTTSVAEESVTNDEPETTVAAGLANAGLVPTAVQIEGDHIAIAVESLGPEPMSVEMTISDGDEPNEVVVTDLASNATINRWNLDIEQSTPTNTQFELSDVDSTGTYSFDSGMPTPSFAFLIPAAFATVAVATALMYLALGVAVVVGGVLAIEASIAAARILVAESRKASSQRNDFFPAVIDGSRVFISGRGLSSLQAQQRGRTGKDVWAVSRERAKALASALNPSGTPIGPEVHQAGYLEHYHPAFHQPNMHCFFGLPT